jgi:hypothetical protein
MRQSAEQTATAGEFYSSTSFEVGFAQTSLSPPSVENPWRHGPTPQKTAERNCLHALLWDQDVMDREVSTTNDRTLLD